MTWSPDRYLEALAFAARAHGDQRVPGTGFPYVTHVVSVAMEVMAAAREDPFDADLAVNCALLHDTLEDTGVQAEEIARTFGDRVLAGVRALTKDAALPKPERMSDSLRRIAGEPREVAIVKLADRITNLQWPPPAWTPEKRSAYREEARQILAALGGACAPLAGRLAGKIDAYGAFLAGG